MRWLIDGYNVIRRNPALRAREAESLEAGRRALVHLVAGLARQGPDDFTIVFDGARREGVAPPRGRVSVVFSRPPETADDVVIRLARERRQSAIVVTSDHVVRDAARRAGCAVLDAEAFLVRAAAGGPAPPARSVSPGDSVDDDVERPTVKRGNPRRLSKKARAAARALRRLPPR